MIADKLIAHRGCSLLRPENTLAAMTLTHEIDIRWVEIDANLVGDGTLVMFHDDYLDRLTPGTGKLAEQRWDDVKDLDVGSHFSADYQAERMPQLSEALQHIAGLRLGLNLEIKVYPSFTAADIVPKVIAALEQHWTDFDRLIISSFDADALRLVRAAKPDWQLGMLYEAIEDDWAKLANELSLVSIHSHYALLQSAQASAIKAAGLDLYCYTVNDRKAGEALWQMGVDGLITDNPLLFLP
ncbi:glycerophosphoryl diester phosphodiesterase [Salinispirillum sp. LH 10-3-1]|uniref:Glycerophosphoryl diester phosphodiesterase n=1 Tax=Salinispirillum sp. LH 10-3-1 TaxID=2952525 RepID=A0AB38YF69_9GAMM